jgi:hypothetical protein
MTDRIDRLYELLPVVYRQRDVEQGYPLRDLLRVIAEQVNVVEDDIARMYDDWFIETCQDWVVPYIGDLIGYRSASAASAADAGATPESRLRHRAVVPRRDVANFVRDLRRSGTLALVEQLSNDSASFPSRAVEFFTLLGRTRALDHPDDRGRIMDLRDGESLELIDSPFDRSGHTIDIRNVTARRNYGLHNIPSAAAYLWRLRSYSVTRAPAYFVQRGGGYSAYTFSALGNDSPLFTKATREPDATIAGELNVPATIRRRALEPSPRTSTDIDCQKARAQAEQENGYRDDYYGLDANGQVKSLMIWLGPEQKPVAAEDIIAADLSGWRYHPPDKKVAVDPVLGRIAIARDPQGVTVSYHYGFSGDVGAHESARTLMQPRGAWLYRVGPQELYKTIGKALDAWRNDERQDAVIEIADSGFYTEPIDIELAKGRTLQIRAANRARPVIYVLDYHPSKGDSLHVTMHERARFTLDGVIVAGRPVRIDGVGEKAAEKAPDVRVAIRRCTLVPGWALDSSCKAMAPAESSLELVNVRGHVRIDRTILGSISVMNETVETDPVEITLRDSILDATSNKIEAVLGPAGSYAWATLSFIRCTVFGTVLAHAIELAENSIFGAIVRVVRRQRGCVRFCYVPPESRTPRRFHCQPDLVERAVRDHAAPNPPDEQKLAEERRRVVPRFTSTRFGDPAYAQLSLCTAPEITSGADDESEMGAFHHLFLPQRIANLRARLDSSTPAGMETGIIYAD